MVTSVRAMSEESPGDDDAGTHEPRRINGLDEVIGDGRVDLGHTGDVDDDHLGAVGADARGAADR